MYHATAIKLTGTLRAGFCATPDRAAALAYVGSGPYRGASRRRAAAARCYRVALVEGVTVASERQLMSAARAVGMTCDYAFEAADDADVRAELVARGFGAVAYGDVGPDNACEHQTVRALVDGALVLAEIA